MMFIEQKIVAWPYKVIFVRLNDSWFIVMENL